MNNRGLFKRMRRLRMVTALLVLLLAYGSATFSPMASTGLPVGSIDLGGVTGATNNTVLAFGRYLLVAPFWPTKGVSESGELELSELDNSFIYVIDTKKPNLPPVAKKLSNGEAQNAKTIYFPSKLIFDSQSNNVYVRGTRFEEKGDQVTAIDVIAYVRLNLDDNGKPIFDSSVVPIDIQGVSSPFTNEAPLDFGFGRNGELMVFTNGASVFSYNLDQGYLYGVGIVPASEYNADDSISFLDVDPATNVVTVCWNRKIESAETTASEISFYRLGENGTLQILKRVYPEQLPGGSALGTGSNVVIVSDGGDSEFALFATTDGSLCSVDLRDDGVQTTVRQMHQFSELEQSSESDRSPLLVQYDSGKRTIGIVKPGFSIQISRPTNGKRGRISRPTNLKINSVPVLAFARLGKKNKVVSANAFRDDFNGDSGLSNFVKGENAQWLISTYSGNLYSVDMNSDLPSSKLTLLGQVGSRVERIEYYPDRANIVAINSFAFEDDGMRVATPGAVVLGKLSNESILSQVSLQTFLPTASLLGMATPAIRRPCNIIRR